MSSISNVSGINPLSTLSQLQSAAGAQRGTTTDGDGGRVHHGHRGGGMGHAVMQALQSLGLNLSQPASPSSQSNAAGTTDSDGDNDGSGGASGASSVRQDLHQFMHALFQAIRSESAGSSDANSAATTAPSGDPRAAVGSGMAALVSQVSNGSAPADLQSAFDKLLKDTQGAAAASSFSNTTGSPASGNATSTVTLQQLLTQLQQTLGYGPASTSDLLGNALTAKG